MKRKHTARQLFIFLNEINALVWLQGQPPRFEITCPKA
jgi:hypothetical protein